MYLCADETYALVSVVTGWKWNEPINVASMHQRIYYLDCLKYVGFVNTHILHFQHLLYIYGKYTMKERTFDAVRWKWKLTFCSPQTKNKGKE